MKTHAYDQALLQTNNYNRTRLKGIQKKKDYKNNIFIIIEMYISNGIDIMKKKYLYYFLIN